MPSDDHLHVDYEPSIFAYKLNVAACSTNQKYMRSQQRRQQQIEKAQNEVQIEAMAVEALVFMSEAACDTGTQTHIMSVRNNSTQTNRRYEC